MGWWFGQKKGILMAAQGWVGPKSISLHNFKILITLESLRVFLRKVFRILIISAKLSTLDLLKINILWNKGYDVIISVHDVTNKTLARVSNYIADLVMGPKIANSCISMKENIITSTLNGFDQKYQFFWGVVLVQVQ